MTDTDSELNPGMNIFISNVAEIDAETEEEFYAIATDLEAQVELTITEALDGSEATTSESNIKAEYIGEYEDDEQE